MPEPTKDQLLARIAELERQAARRAPALSFKVSEKGAVSVYGLGRFPVTHEQWQRLLGGAAELESFLRGEQEPVEVEGRELIMAAPTAFLYHAERIDGVDREKPTPKKLHIRIQNRILKLMFGAGEAYPSFEPMPELATLLDKGTDFLVPDIVVARTDAHYENGMLHARDALVAIEILSPGQTIDELFGKSKLLLAAGCPLCWVIWGERRRAWIHLADDLREVTQLEADTLPAAWWINLEQLLAGIEP